MSVENLLADLQKIAPRTAVADRIKQARGVLKNSQKNVDVECELSGFSNEDEHFREFDQFREHNPA